jgi:hypothetical protein
LAAGTESPSGGEGGAVHSGEAGQRTGGRDVGEAAKSRLRSRSSHADGKLVVAGRAWVPSPKAATRSGVRARSGPPGRPRRPPRGRWRPSPSSGTDSRSSPSGSSLAPAWRRRVGTGDA